MGRCVMWRITTKWLVQTDSVMIWIGIIWLEFRIIAFL
jgi:hypothetical protein